MGRKSNCKYGEYVIFPYMLVLQTWLIATELDNHIGQKCVKFVLQKDLEWCKGQFKVLLGKLLTEAMLSSLGMRGYVQYTVRCKES